MKHRFRFLATPQGEAWIISGPEQTHLRQVLRLTIGTEVEVFDGKGQSATGKIAEISSEQTAISDIHLISQTQSQPLIAILSALKPQNIDDILAPLTELGVTQFHIFQTEGAPKLTASTEQKVIDRWQRILLSACKQSKRDSLPSIAHWPNLRTLLEKSDLPPTRVILDPEACESLTTFGDLTQGACFACGSEKGLTPRELDPLKSANFTPVTLTPHILRATTAAIAATAVLSTRLHHLLR